MQLSIRLVTRPRPGVWPRVAVTVVIIVIVAIAGWAAYGPSGAIAVLAGSGALAQLTPLARRQGAVRPAGGTSER
jgi:hypothetical protein